MGTPGPTPDATLEGTVAVFTDADQPCTPLTAREVADRLGCARRTAHRKLERLAERGDLETKKVGARGRVWWRPVDAGDGRQGSIRDQFGEFVRAVRDYAIFALDDDGTVASWNEGAERIKGYGRDEIVGEHFSTFYTEDDVERGVPARNLEAAEEHGRIEDEGWRVRADGAEFWANVVITAIHDDDGSIQGFTKVTRDMTEQKRAEDERRLRHSVSMSVAEAESLEGGLEAAVADVCEFTEWEYGEAWLPADGRLERSPITYAASDALAPFAEASMDRSFAPGEGLVGRVWQSGEPEWLPDVTDADDGAFRRAVSADEVGLKATFCVPIVSDGEGAAVLLFSMTESRETDDRLVGTVESVAAELGGLVSRKRAEDALRRERELLDRILEASPIGIAAIAPDGEVVRMNDRAAETFGTDSGDLALESRSLYGPDGEPLPDEDRPSTRVLDTGEPVYDREVALEGSDGRRWLSISAAPLEGADGGVERIVIAGEDITRRKEYERELERRRRELETELGEVFGRISDAFYALDEEWCFTHVNERAEQVLGRPEEAVLGEDLRETFPAISESVAWEEFNEAMETQEPVSFEFYFDPLEIWAEVNAYPSETGLSVYLRDVTERVEREHELEQYETIVDTVEDGICILGPDFRFQEVNDAYAGMTGYDREELIGSHCSLVLDEDDSGAITGLTRELTSGNGGSTVLETDVVTREGDRIPAESRFTAIPADDGFRGSIGVVRDLSERKEYERELRRYETLIEESTDVNAILDSEGTVQYVTPSVEYVLGYAPGELVGESAFGYIHPDDRGESRANFAALAEASDDPATTEFRFRHADGSWVWLESRGRNLRDDPMIDGIVVYTRDVTERKEYERELERQRNELATLDSLNELVHEVTHLAIESSTREGIESLVCEHLAESDSYRFAWIGEIDRDHETITARAEAGTDGYLDGISIRPDDSAEGRGPTGRAIRTGEVHAVREIGEDPEYEPWRERAREYGIRSSAAIPLEHEGTLYGVLNLYSARPDAFGDDERAVIGRLGRVIGHAINAVERKRALMSEDVVEIQFQVQNVLDAVDAQGTTDGTITFDRAIPVSDDEFLEYGTATGDALDTLTGLVERFPHFESVTILDEDNETSRFELRLSEPPAISTVASYGGRVVSAAISGGDYRMVVHVPPSADVEGVVEAVNASYPDATVVAQRHTTRAERPAARLESILLEELTERQRTALESAYFAGFFEWPRDSSGEDVADSLGVSPSTFHQHVRAAERKLLDALFADPPRHESPARER